MNMEFERKLKWRVCLQCLVGLVGIAAIVVSFFVNIAFASGFYMGTGTALFAFSLVKTIQSVRTLRDETRKKPPKSRKKMNATGSSATSPHITPASAPA